MHYNRHQRRGRDRQIIVRCGHFVIVTLLLILAVSAYGNDIADYPKAFQKQLRNAQYAFQAEEWHEALRLYQALAKQAPEFPIVSIGEGDAAAKLKDYPTAITAFQRALQRLSTQPQGNITISRLQLTVQAKLAAAYHRNKQLDEADMWFQKAVKGAGEDAPVAWYVALGQIETERGNLEQARRYYIVAVQLHPETTAAYNNLGHVLLKLNRLDEADAVSEKHSPKTRHLRVPLSGAVKSVQGADNLTSLNASMNVLSDMPQTNRSFINHSQMSCVI